MKRCTKRFGNAVHGLCAVRKKKRAGVLVKQALSFFTTQSPGVNSEAGATRTTDHEGPCPEGVTG